MSTSAAQVPTVGANKDPGPVVGYTPSAVAAQHPAYRLVIEAVELQRSLRSMPIDQRFLATRELAVEWYSALAGRLKDEDPDLKTAAKLVDDVFSGDIPYADFPIVTHASAEKYTISMLGPGRTGLSVLQDDLQPTLRSLLQVETERKYLAALNRISPMIAKLRGLAAKHKIWNDRTAVQSTVSANSIERITEQIDLRDPSASDAREEGRDDP